MLIGYKMPAVNVVALAAGSAWLTSDGGSALFDGKPARATRLQRSSGNPTINVTLASAIVVRVIALLGVNLPEGVTVTVAGTSGVTRRLADGTVACWIVLPVAAATASVSVVITTAQSVIQIGELVIMPAVEVAHESDWSVNLVDPSQSERSLASQLATNPRQPYRQLTASFTPDGLAVARGGGLANGMDWERLRFALAMDKRCVVIPRWRTTAGEVDAVELSRTAIYGVARIAEIQHLQGDFYGSSIVAMEVPALT